jgi:SNF2 family DNA or RNA helicase
MKYKPHNYQKYATQWILDKEKSGLLMDMGLGKTVVTLTAIDELINKFGDVVKVLVIAPLRVAEDTWSSELQKWDHLKHLKMSKVLGTDKVRRTALKLKADIYVINRENVVWLVKLYGEEWPFDMVVIDELSSFKSPSSKRFKALKKVRPKRIVGLTGTPAPNSLLDLWSQIYLLDQGERLGKTIFSYRNKYFLPDKRNQRIIFSYKLKKGADTQIYDKIADICVSMKAEDYLKLPERINNIILVKLSKVAERKYQKLEKELLLQFENSDIVVNSAAVLTNKLLQLSNGAVYDENGDVIEINEEKIKALGDII